MKQKLQKHWPWLAALLAVGLLCATYLLAQIGQGNGASPTGNGNDAQEGESASTFPSRSDLDYIPDLCVT